MVTANIIATPRRKRGVVTNSPLTVKSRPADKYLEGIYFGKLKLGLFRFGRNILTLPKEEVLLFFSNVIVIFSDF